MEYKKGKILLKNLMIFISFILIMNFTGCSLLRSKTDEETMGYKDFALKTLEERYGEKFEIKKVGGTFGANRDTRKLICYPVSNEDDFCFVEVERDFSDVYDNYFNRIIGKRIEEKLYNLASPIFGEEIIVKVGIGGMYFEPQNLEETADEFLEKKKGGMAIEVLIRSEGIPENIHEEAEKIQIFMQELLNKGLDQNNYVGFCYVKEQHYENINKVYGELEYKGEEYSYYLDGDISYTSTNNSIKDRLIERELESVEETLNIRLIYKEN